MKAYYSNNPRLRISINTPPYIVTSYNKPRIVLRSFFFSRTLSCRNASVFLGTAYFELVWDYSYISRKQIRSTLCLSIEHAFPQGLQKVLNAAMSTQPCPPDPTIALASLLDRSNFPQQYTFSKLSLSNKISDPLWLTCYNSSMYTTVVVHHAKRYQFGPPNLARRLLATLFGNAKCVWASGWVFKRTLQCRRDWHNTCSYCSLRKHRVRWGFVVISRSTRYSPRQWCGICYSNAYSPALRS